MGVRFQSAFTRICQKAVSFFIDINSRCICTFYPNGGCPLQAAFGSLQESCKGSHVQSQSFSWDCPRFHGQHSLDGTGKTLVGWWDLLVHGDGPYNCRGYIAEQTHRPITKWFSCRYPCRTTSFGLHQRTQGIRSRRLSWHRSRVAFWKKIASETRENLVSFIYIGQRVRLFQSSRNYPDKSLAYALPVGEALQCQSLHWLRNVTIGTILQLPMYGMGRSYPRLLWGEIWWISFPMWRRLAIVTEFTLLVGRLWLIRRCSISALDFGWPDRLQDMIDGFFNRWYTTWAFTIGGMKGKSQDNSSRTKLTKFRWLNSAIRWNSSHPWKTFDLQQRY